MHHTPASHTRLIAWIFLLTVLPAIPAVAQDTQPSEEKSEPSIMKIIRKATGTSGAPAEEQSQDSEASDDAIPETLADCRTAYQAGAYDKAGKGYRLLRKQDNLRVAASIGLAEVQAIQGRYREALETLDACTDDAVGHAEWHALRAELLVRTGHYTRSIDSAETALQLQPLYPRALLLKGTALETLGRDDEAVKTYREMEDIVASDDFRPSAEAMVALGQILDRYATLTGRKASDQAQNILHNYLQEAYQKVDKTYWQANVAAGMFLLSKHKPKAASKEFSLALKQNSQCPDAYAGLAAAMSGNFEKCLELADKALEINPHHDLALYMQAVCYMQWRKFQNVPPILETILEVNPNHIEALSLMAAAHIRMGQDQQARLYKERVQKIDPSCHILPQTIGDWLVAGRQFPQAEAYLIEARELAPRMAEPVASLGKMYMQTGEEAKAMETLQAAHALDDFRADVVNYLNVAKRLQTFAICETDHFIIKVDPKHDLVLLRQVAEYMESVYPEVTGEYNHEPTRKTIIEIMPFQKEFSARIAGRGWVPTVGACTGRVIAVTAPNRERGKMGLHNWAQVLRHEFAHTVTLEATNNRIPHWLTEACAVRQQKDRRAFRYIKTLVTATQQGRLFPIAELDWGFIRPKRPTDRGQAYAQSEWTLEFIIRKHGFAKLGELLHAFSEGKSQEQVFQEVLGTTQMRFDEAFRQWAQQQVEQWGFDPEPPGNWKQTAGALETNPGDPDLLAEHARALLAKRKIKEARQAVEKALEINPNHVPALRVQAKLHLGMKQYDKAVSTCQRIEELDPTTRTVPNVLARAYIAQKDWSNAISALEMLKTRCPLEAYSYEQLAKIYVQFGQPEKALPNLEYLHQHTMNDPQYARQIAEIYRSQGQNDLALKYFQEILFINPYETSAHEGLASIYTRTGQYDRARQSARNMTLLEPDSAKSWNYLASVLYRSGKAQGNVEQLHEAREYAQKAQQIDPNGQAGQVLQFIDIALEDLQTTSGATE